MKYYSDLTRKFYEDAAECEKAEKELVLKQEEAKKAELAKAEARKADAEAVEIARKAAVEANAAYRKALNEFCSKHGAFHSTVKLDDIDDLFNWFFKF